MGPSFEEFKQEKAFMMDYWQFRKEFYNGRGEDQSFWARLYQAAENFDEKYKSGYQRSLLSACIEDILERAKNEH